MMTINAFWFGYLMGIISIIVLAIILSLIHKKTDEDEIEPITVEELKDIIREVNDEGKHEE